MIKVICAGYADEYDVKRSCGAYIGTLMDSREGVSHGICKDCLEASLRALAVRKERESRHVR